MYVLPYNNRRQCGIELLWKLVLWYSLHYLITQHCLSNQLFLNVLSDHLELLIKLFYYCIARSTWKVSNCNYVRVAESFSWYAIEHRVPSGYNFCFWFFCFVGLFLSSFPNIYVPYLFVEFQFYYWYYWVLGDPFVLLSMKFKSSYCFASKENL